MVWLSSGARLPVVVAALGALLSWGGARALVASPRGGAPPARGEAALATPADGHEDDALHAAIERMERRGTIVGPVLPLPTRAGANGEARFLVLLGHDAVANAAWIVEGDGARPVDDFPAGARVVGSVTAGEETYLLLESAAVLDQRVGMRGVWRVEGARSPGDLVTFEGAADVAEVARRAGERRHEVSFEEARPLLERIARASDQDTELAALVDDVPSLRVWQGTFVEHLRTYPSQQRARAAELARAALGAQRCEAGVCTTRAGGAAAPAIAFARGASGAPVVRAIVETQAPAIVHDATPPTRGLGGASAAARAIFLAHAAGEPGPAVDVPLGDDGLLALAGTAVAMKRGAFEQVFSLGLARAPDEARFVDVDYDGRPDLVTRTAEGCTAVFHTPGTLAGSAPHSMPLDDGATLRAIDAPDLDAAARAATTFEPYGVAAYDACGLLAHVGPSAFALGGRVVHTSAAAPTCAPRVTRAEEAPPEDLARIGAACAGGPLECDARRAFCRTSAGDVLAFSRNGPLRITKAWIVD